MNDEKVELLEKYFLALTVEIKGFTEQSKQQHQELKQQYQELKHDLSELKQEVSQRLENVEKRLHSIERYQKVLTHNITQNRADIDDIETRVDFIEQKAS